MSVWPYLEDKSWRSQPPSLGALPRITVITPSFNQGRFIEETILSVLHQDYPNLQYIVVDNCSKDQTPSVLEKYRDRIDIVIVEPDSGQSDALNKGFRQADGTILTWLNADDMFAPGALHQVARAFSASPESDVVAGSLMYRVDDDVIYEHITAAAPGPLSLDELLDVEASWMLGRYFYQPEVFFTRDIFDRAGGKLDERLFYSMDYDLWVRMAAAGAVLSVIGTPLAIFRGHPDQKTSSPSKFLPELRAHAAAMRNRYGLPDRATESRAVRHLKIAFVSDTPDGGASIAHSRLCKVAKALGHEANIIHLLSEWSAERPTIDVGGLKGTLGSYEPDVVILGNVHGVSNAVEVLNMVVLNFNTIFYAHDMWIMTGRCAYTRGCVKFMDLCDHRCPTYKEYPQADPSDIAGLHRSKLRMQSVWDLAVFANSHWMAGNIETLWRSHGLTLGAARSVAVLPPVCDVTAFLAVDRKAARAALQLPDDADIVVCSANNFADSRKGMGYLLDAMGVLARRERPPLIIMAGWAHADIRALAARYENVAFLGHVEPQITPLVYGSADLLLSAAVDEAFGMVYVEAAAAGARSVTFATGGVADAVNDGVSGMLVQERSGEALAAAVLMLLDRKARGEDLARQPRMWAQAEHSDIAAARRFAEALAGSEPARSEAFARVQLHRRRSLDDATGCQVDRVPVESVCVKRHTSVNGLGEVGFAVYGEAGEPSFHLVRLMLDVQIGATPTHLDLKVIQRNEELLLDLRPHESHPAIYSRALVELGPPFFSDGWGPTLIMPLGSGEAMSQLEACLPGLEILAFKRFAEVVERVLGNASIAANVQAAMDLVGFSADLQRVRSGFAAWRQGSSDGPDGDTVNASTEAALP